MAQNHYLRKGSIGITVVMLVFCYLMSVTMAYHKQLQTETLVQKQADYSDKAMDAAFSGINYAIATIQAEKKVFSGTKKVLFLKSEWVCLDKNMQFSNYYSDKTRMNGSKIEADRNPPYRFKVGCDEDFYTDSDTICIKSIGEYIQYNGEDKIASFTAQIMAECKLDKVAKTIRIKKYRKMNPNESKLFKFDTYNEE